MQSTCRLKIEIVFYLIVPVVPVSLFVGWLAGWLVGWLAVPVMIDGNRIMPEQSLGGFPGPVLTQHCINERHFILQGQEGDIDSHFDS